VSATASVEISPIGAFRPTMPQAAAGMRMDPPVSVPRAASAIPVATATGTVLAVSLPATGALAAGGKTGATGCGCRTLAH